MAITRQQNFLGSQRVDVPHLRAIESAVTRDFDVLAGMAMGGKAPLIVKGFNLLSSTRAEDLQLEVGGSIAIHYLATDSGSIFAIDEDVVNEVLSNQNSKVVGGFTPSSDNYVGVDFYRQEDDTTADLVAFIDPTDLVESIVRTPLARTIQYRIRISSIPFESTPGVLPVAKVTTNADNSVSAIQDCRSLMFRLGSGGSIPDSLNAFPWAQGRVPTTAFTGGDKGIDSLKDWMDAVMTRLWEIGGGERWYSASCDRNIRLTYTGAPFASNGEYFEWDGTNVHWKGLSIIFDNSTGSYNNIANQTVDLAGKTDLVDGECIYVDLDRGHNLSGASSLVPAKAALSTLGYNQAGARVVLAWRYGANVFVRDQVWAVNHTQVAATKLALGSVAISATPSVPAFPVATVLDGGLAIAGGLSRGITDFGFGDLVIGGNANDDNIKLMASASAILGYGLGTAATPVLLLESSTSLDDTAGKTLMARAPLSAGDPTLYEQISIENSGAIAFNRVPNTPATPGAAATVPKAKVFLKRDANNIDQLCVMWKNGSIVPIKEDLPLHETVFSETWNFAGTPAPYDPRRIWDTTTGAGSTLANDIPSYITTSEIPSVLRCFIGAVSPTSSVVSAFKDTVMSGWGTKWIMEGKIGVGTAGVLADELATVNLSWGVTSLLGGYILFKKRAADVVWSIETRTSAGVVTNTPTAIAQTGEHFFKIEHVGATLRGVPGSSLRCWIDDTLVTTVASPGSRMFAYIGGERAANGVQSLVFEAGPVTVKTWYL